MEVLFAESNLGFQLLDIDFEAVFEVVESEVQDGVGRAGDVVSLQGLDQHQVFLGDAVLVEQFGPANQSEHAFETSLLLPLLLGLLNLVVLEDVPPPLLIEDLIVLGNIVCQVDLVHSPFEDVPPIICHEHRLQVVVQSMLLDLDPLG